MHPASTTAASGGLSAAAVVILMWLLSLVHIEMPADVAAAFGIVITAGIGYVMHTRIAAKDASGAVAPVEPAAAAASPAPVAQ